jgi:hypothetical protein
MIYRALQRGMGDRRGLALERRCVIRIDNPAFKP